MKGKKASHVGVVLSFVIFITFIIFLYSITEPITRVERGKQDLLKFLKIELINEFSADMTTETILIKNTAVSDCIKIKTEDRENSVAIAKDEETGEILETYFDNGDVEIKRDEATKLKVYYSEEFINGEEELGCTLLSEEDYEFGLVRTLKYVFSNSIINLSERISNPEEYKEIKDKFNIPAGDEFGFSFEDGDRNVIVQTEEKEVSTDIYVEEVPIQYVDNEANIKPGFLRIKVW